MLNTVNKKIKDCFITKNTNHTNMKQQTQAMGLADYFL